MVSKIALCYNLEIIMFESSSIDCLSVNSK